MKSIRLNVWYEYPTAGWHFLQKLLIADIVQTWDSSVDDYCNVLSMTNDGTRIGKGKYTDNKGPPQLMFQTSNAETAHTLQK